MHKSISGKSGAQVYIYVIHLLDQLTNIINAIMTTEGSSLLHRQNDEERAIIRSNRCAGMMEYTKSVFTDFKNFINKGSVLDLAVGIVIGEAFSSVVNSFVSDIFSPILGLIVSSKLSEAFVVIKKGEHYPYKTREEARKDGAVTWNYGNFLQLMINFLCIAVALYLVMKMSKSVQKKRISTKSTKECPRCFSEIDGRATKCANCTADVNGDDILM